MSEQHESVAARLGGGLVEAAAADVGFLREAARRRRLTILAVVLGIPALYLWLRIVAGAPFDFFRLPTLPPDWPIYLIPIAIVLALGAAVAAPLLSGRSPHVLYRPEEIEVSFEDVKGLDPILDEVVKTLNIFLGHRLYRDRLGGTPRRGLLFEGAPGTGKTHLAKAMARQAGVPFLYASSTSFQSMWYGATARRIRSYFKQLRKAALREGGAIGFIEEIDAIAGRRSEMSSAVWQGTISRAGGCNTTPATPASLEVNAFTSEGTGGVVNELLVQMQSFDTPPFGHRVRNRLADMINAFLPPHRNIKRRPAPYHNVLLIAATNRADMLDPALLRPGRFDRRLTFELPARSSRRELVDYFLDRKAHDPGLDEGEARDLIAAQTFGYTPVMLGHLFDEALVLALKGGHDGMSANDVQEARLIQEVGLKNPVEYTARERQVVATHEAGHATVAYLAGTRRLEVLTIIKRSGSLGLLAHGDLEEVYTRTKAEMYALVDIAMGGMVAEELWFGEASTGPSSDLAYATRVACEIVGSAGMGSSLVSLAAVENSALNDTNIVGRVLGDREARPEVDRLLATAKVRVRALLDANRHLVEALRDALLERDELVGEEISAVLTAAGAPVIEGLRHDLRTGDRRRRDWLSPAEN
ncbi:MAG: AAA family ATPase [Actinobacteria bacterium]|nr:AAA family ATPase [Actinomycetota bacterium]